MGLYYWRENEMPRKKTKTKKYKLKTHKATAKRFKVTGSGKRVRRLAPYLRKYKANPPA